MRMLENVTSSETRSRIHERTISLRFLGIILRVLSLEVFVYNVYNTNQFQPTLLGGWGGEGKSVSRCVYIARKKILKTFVPIMSKNSASGPILIKESHHKEGGLRRG